MADAVEMTYVALRRMKVGGQTREKGELVPEAATWRTVDSYIRTGHIAAVPKSTVDTDELAAAEERLEAYSRPVSTSQEEPTKDELYEEAQELDVPGRSDMNKDELAEAVEEEREDEKPEKKKDAGDDDLDQYAVGGGWYEVPGAEKKMRREDALEFLTSPEAGEE